MSGIFLTTKEIDNIYMTYGNYGPEKMAEFIQSIWTEAFQEGYDKAVADIRRKGS